MAHKRREHDYDFDVPWRLIDGEVAHALGDDEDSEQHKRRRNQRLHKRSIRHYRHATGKWGAALESLKPIWVRSRNFLQYQPSSDSATVRHCNLNRRSRPHPRLALPLLSPLATAPSIRSLRFRNRTIRRLHRPYTRSLDHVPPCCCPSRARRSR